MTIAYTHADTPLVLHKLMVSCDTYILFLQCYERHEAIWYFVLNLLYASFSSPEIKIIRAIMKAKLTQKTASNLE